MKTTLRLKRFANPITWFVLFCTAAWPTQARTLTWTGDSFSDPTLWSKSGNWSPSFVPADGDALIFPGSASTTTSFNDLVNLHVFSITFNGSSGSTLNGNVIFIDNAITASHTGGRARVNFDLTFTTGAVTFYTFSDGYLDIEQNVSLGNNDLVLYPLNTTASGTNIEVHGIITGSGGLTKLGSGDAHLLGVWPNEYSGLTSVQAGRLHLSKSSVTAISSQLTVGFNPSGAFASVIDHASDQYPPGISATLSNGSWNMNYSATVTNLTLMHSSITGSGILGLLSDVTVLHGGDAFVGDSAIQCSLYLGNQSRTFWVEPTNDYGSTDLYLNGAVIGPGLPNNSPGIIKEGFGDLHLRHANSYFGPTEVNQGDLWVEVTGALGSYAEADAGTTVNDGGLFLLAQTLNEPVVMAGGDTIFFDGLVSFNGSLVLSNYIFFRAFDDASSLQINSTVSGPASFSVIGGTVRLGGSTPNTFGSNWPYAYVVPSESYYTTTNATLELAKPNNVVAMPVPVIIQGGTTRTGVLRNLQNGGVSDVTLYHNGSWLLNGYTVAPVSLKFADDGIVNTGAGQLQLNYTGTNQLHALSGSFNGRILGTVNCVGSMVDITVEPFSGLDIAAQIIGGGALRKLGAGTLKFSGSAANTYSGGTLVSEGTLELHKTNNVLAVPGNIIIGPVASNSLAVARFFQNSGMPQGAAATVNGNSLLDLNGFGQILGLLNLNDGGDVQTGGGILTFSAGSSINVDTLDYVFGLRASASISGNVDLPHFDTVTCNVTRYDSSYVSAQPELDVPANISGNGDLHKSGAGQMRLSGNNTFNDSPPTSAGNVQVLGGTLIAANATALGGTGGVTFVDTAGILALDGGITITGEPLSLFSTNAPGLQNLTGANTWSGDIRLYRDGIVGVNAGGSLLIDGVIFGTGNLTKIGSGALTLGGGPNNTYSGDTFANDGTLVLDKIAISGPITIPHHITVGTGQAGNTATLVENDENGIAGSVTVNDGGLLTLYRSEFFSDLTLQGHPPLTLNGNAQVQMSSIGYLFLPPGGGIVVNPGSNTTATLSGRIALSDGLGNLSPRPVTVSAGANQSGNPECLINASIEQTIFGVAGLQKEGAGTLRLTGTNIYTGTNLVNGGTLWVDGPQPQSPVQLNTGTRLKGSGTVGHINLVGSSVTIAPGNSPGILTCSNFNAGAAGSGTLEMEMNAHTPFGYDEINTRGTVTLTGLSLSPTLNFTSSVGQNFTLIGNDGTDAVTGTFIGLPQNAKLYIGGELFQISYIGGSGNDVLLSRLTTPPPPRLAIEHVPPASIRLIWATNDPPFSLQSATNLSTPTWILASPPPPVIVGTNNLVTNAISGGQKFYRLINP